MACGRDWDEDVNLQNHCIYRSRRRIRVTAVLPSSVLQCSAGAKYRFEQLKLAMQATRRDLT